MFKYIRDSISDKITTPGDAVAGEEGPEECTGDVDCGDGTVGGDAGEEGPVETTWTGGGNTGDGTEGGDAGEKGDAKTTGTETDGDEDFILCGMRGCSSTCSLK